MKIRRLEYGDHSKLKKFFSGLTDETIKDWNEFPSVKEEPDKIIWDIYEMEGNGKRRTWIVEMNDAIVGYGRLAFVRDKVCSLGMVISDSCQETGVGAELVGCLVKEAGEMGQKKIWLHVFQDNTRAFKLYVKMGFVIEGFFLNEVWQDEKPRNVISMAKYLYKQEISFVGIFDSFGDGWTCRKCGYVNSYIISSDIMYSGGKIRRWKPDEGGYVTEDIRCFKCGEAN